MTAARSELDPARAQAYCREARKLRHRLKHAPVRLHRSLRALRPAEAAPVESTPNDRFAEMVVRSIESGTLRYSRRLQLLRESDKLGIERFEANLIIAMVQHKLGQSPIEATPRRSSILPWLMFAALQTGIILAGCVLWLKLR